MPASYAYYPEVKEDEDRIVHNDRLRTRRPRKTFSVKRSAESRICEKLRLGGPSFTDANAEGVTDEPMYRDEWMLSAPFVPLDEIPADPSILTTDVPEDIRDEDLIVTGH